MTGPGQNSPSWSAASREALLVVALTIAGGVIRLWAPQHLGLVHFDEGIYALAGLWPFSKGGLAAIDPTVIAYAPPGFPFLVGVSYLVLGISDVAAILVSVAMGTLTIPLAAWLARRTFGAGAGAAAAALVAFSGAHVAFSRMALTDVSFLFCWTLGMSCAQRFLERPGLLTALALGCSTGLAQLFKYNGWLIGGFVVLAALLGVATDRTERTRPRMAAVWGYGLLAAFVSGVIYWPWFQFVESHGGYSRLMAHHRGYLSGPETWLAHLLLQLSQIAALSGGRVWVVIAAVAATAVAVCIVGLSSSIPVVRLLFLILATAGLAVYPGFLWMYSFLVLAVFRIDRGASERMLTASWVGLSVMTPLYHPYARLWLPLDLLGWIVMAGAVTAILSGTMPSARTSRGTGDAVPVRSIRAFLGGPLVMLFVAFVIQGPRVLTGPGFSPRVPLAPSDSLRSATRRALADLPANTPGLRLLVRPPVTFYLGGKVPAKVEPSLSGLMEPGNPGLWALVDLAMLQQQGDLGAATEALRSRWELVREYPTELNLPTLLDVDPGTARRGRSEAAQAPLWLLRPRTAGASP